MIRNAGSPFLRDVANVSASVPAPVAQAKINAVWPAMPAPLKRTPRSRSPTTIVVEAIGAAFKRSALIQVGLATAYSPNHTLTTGQHKIRQSEMLSACTRGDYAALAQMVAHPNEKLRATPEKIRALLEPLLSAMTPGDYRVLAVVVGIHDFGKVDIDWAKSVGLDLAGSDFIAHDYETEILLKANPGVLEKLVLTRDDALFVEKLSKLHSLPGQYFFGEGHLAAYAELCDIPGYPPVRALRIARVHGLLDVMSALNENFVHFILDSHLALGQAIDNVLADSGSLVEQFECGAVEQTPASIRGVGSAYGLSDVSTYRLTKLAGLKGDQASSLLESALVGLDRSFIEQFDKSTSGTTTWYGTYIANAFGQGLIRKLGDPSTAISPEQATIEGLRATIKMVALGCAYSARFMGKQSFAFSANKPSLVVAEGPVQALAMLHEIQQLTSLDQGLRHMAGGKSLLTLRGNNYATEIGYRGVGPNAVDGVAATLREPMCDLRFYHLVNHLVANGFDPATRDVAGAVSGRVAAAFADHSENATSVRGEPVGEPLGSGQNGRVHALRDGVIKFPKIAARCLFLEIEAAVAAHLEAHFDLYGIHIVPIRELGPEGSYLIKERVSPEALGTGVATRGLDAEQRLALQRLYEGARRYAADTGISLDLAANNLVWRKAEGDWRERGEGRWEVVDPGPRTSAGPRKYKFTLDCPDFQTYLARWS